MSVHMPTATREAEAEGGREGRKEGGRVRGMGGRRRTDMSVPMPTATREAEAEGGREGGKEGERLSESLKMRQSTGS